MKSITTFSPQRRGNYESGDACAHNAIRLRATNAKPASLGARSSVSICTSDGSISTVISDIETFDLEPGAPASLSSHHEPSEFQVLYILETSRPLEETPVYVNARQYERILKRRVVKQRLEA